MKLVPKNGRARVCENVPTLTRASSQGDEHVRRALNAVMKAATGLTCCAFALGLIMCCIPFTAETQTSLSPPQVLTAQDHVDCIPEGVGRKCTISRPDVTRPLTEYPEVEFHSGDRVLVSAQGCVNVGLTSPDWRRYVDPEGSRTDRFFHGLIWIPGARIYDKSEYLVTPVGTAPVRISSIAGGKDNPSKSELLVIGNLANGEKSTLRLGYETDYGRPWTLNKKGQHPRPRLGAEPGRSLSLAYDGNPSGHQCDNMGVATVTVRITPENNQRPPTASPTRPLLSFDPVSKSIDENGFMFAPRFYGNLTEPDTKQLEATSECKNFEYKNPFLVRYGIRSPCTQQASFDVPPHVLTECLLAPGFGQLHGHVNWAPSTFIGKLRSQGTSADRDFDLQLFTLDDLDRNTRFANSSDDVGKVEPVLTSDSQPIGEYRNALWLEFASYETFNVTSPKDPSPRPSGYEFWDNLSKKALDAKDTDHTAVVTGLLNLDCVHDCHTELHPVFAMAVRTKREDLAKDIVNDDSWAIFVRNAGNEGDCGADEHYLNRDAYTFFLPAPLGALRETPNVENPVNTFSANDDGITWKLYPAPGRSGVYLTFSFAPTACRKLYSRQPMFISGVLHLNWGDNPDSFREVAPASALCPVTRIGDNQPQQIACTREDIGDVDPQTITNNEKKSARLHDRNPPQTLSHVPELLNDLIGRDIGVFSDVLLYNKTSQIQINPGFRAAVVQTSLGSFEVDASPGLSRSVRSTNGSNLSVRISDLLYGFKLRFPTELNIFAEAKGGMLFRSASAGYATTPDFAQFNGHNALFLAGGGIEPGKQTLSRGIKVFVRVSVDYIYLPGTGEHMVRVTVGPQFRFPRK